LMEFGVNWLKIKMKTMLQGVFLQLGN